MISLRVLTMSILCIFMGVILLNIPAMASPPDNFTAVMVTDNIQIPMAKMGSNIRIENVGMKGVVTILLNDVKKIITLNTNKKLYHEQPLKQHDRMVSFYDPDLVFEKKKIGTEKIDGHPCNKYDAIYYRKSNPKEKQKALIWEATDLKDFPIKMEAESPQGKTTILYRDIKLGAAKASMFEVPKGYTKTSSVQEVMGMEMGLDREKMQELMKKMEKGRQ